MIRLTRRTVRLLCLILTVSTIGCDQVTRQIAADQLTDVALMLGLALILLGHRRKLSPTSV